MRVPGIWHCIHNSRHVVWVIIKDAAAVFGLLDALQLDQEAGPRLRYRKHRSGHATGERGVPNAYGERGGQAAVREEVRDEWEGALDCRGELQIPIGSKP